MELKTKYYDIIGDDFSIDVEECKKLALNSDMNAIIKLSWHYFMNLHNEEDNKTKLLEMLNLAGRLGNLDAYIEIGLLYQDLTSFFDEDWYSIAHNNYDKAIASGNIYALNFKSELYIEFQELDNEWYIKANDCLNEAVNKGDIIALLLLGNLNYNCSEDYDIFNKEKALEYYTKALEKGNKEASFKIGQYYEDLNDYNNALVYYNKSLEYKLHYAPSGLSTITEKINIKENTAITTFIKEVNEGNVEAMVSLGYCYERSIGVPYNDEEAFKYYKMAADKGSLLGMNYVSNYYLSYSSKHRNEKEGMILLTKSADGGCVEAQYKMGNIYSYETKYELASKYYLMAADQGCTASAYAISEAYLIGLGVPKDFKKYLHYLQLSKR